MLSLAAGYSASEAKTIAEWDQRADTDPDKSPMPGWTHFGGMARGNYHFTSTVRRAAMWRQFEGAGSLEDLGLYLHAEEDSYSHAGYSWLSGQTFSLIDHWGTGTLLGNMQLVDKTWFDPGRADVMAKNVYQQIQKAAEGRVHVPWATIEPYVQRFNRAKTDDEQFAIAHELELFINNYR